MGSPVAGRAYRSWSGVVGSFVNMVPCAADRRRPDVRRARSHQVRRPYSTPRAPGPPLPPARQRPERGARHQPFAGLPGDVRAERPPRPARPLQGGNSPRSTADSGHPVRPRALPQRPTDEGLSGSFTYRTDLFEPASVERIDRSIRAFPPGGRRRPARRLSEVALLGDTERGSLLGEWGGYPRLAAPTARCTRSAEAPGRARPRTRSPWSPRERRSPTPNCTAAAEPAGPRAARPGVGPGARVAICLDETVDAAVAILAVLKAGGAYLPLDPEQPRDRLEFLLADSSAVLLVTDSALRDRAAGFAGPVVELDRLPGEGDDTPLEPLAGPGDLAYVIYTSGTTGRPKGVGVEHRHIVAYLEYIREDYGIAADATFGLLQSLAFDFSMLMFYLPLTGGGTLHQLPRRGSGPRARRRRAGSRLSEDDALPPRRAGRGGRARTAAAPPRAHSRRARRRRPPGPAIWPAARAVPSSTATAPPRRSWR